MMSALALAAFAAFAAASEPSTVDVDVYVPLCDGSALACGAGGLGEPRNVDENLYWGAMYGAERFLTKKAHGFRVVSKRDAVSSSILRELVVERAPSAGERAVRMRLLAYAGDKIDDAVADFFRAVDAGGDTLLVWSGHDRLMDVDPPKPSSPSSPSSPKTHARVVVLACESSQFFGPALAARGAQQIAMTRTFMAPEAYLLEALAASIARDANPRDALVDAYAKYQKISTKAASSVFAR